MNTKSSYKQIVKSAGIFGSSQLINVFLGIVRSKLTAVLLGVAGVGVFGIIQSVIDLIRSFTGLGLDSGTTIIIAKQATTKNEEEIGKTFYTVNIWYLATAILGALACILFARPLSLWAFESYGYSKHIMLVSIAVFFVGLTSGITASLQGLRRIKYMALSSTISSISTLVVMVPLYYFLRLKGIIPLFIIANLIMFGIAAYFYGRLQIKSIRISAKEVVARGKEMLQLGLYIVVAGLMSTASLFIVRAYISRTEGIEGVGLFQAAWVMIVLLGGIVLKSINADYFPKLSALISDKRATKLFVNEQTHITLLVTSPLIVGLIVFSDFVIQLLYTSEFVAATSVFRWHLLGVFFKIASTSLATILLASNKGRVHLLCESVFWSTYLLSIYLLYPLVGMVATGIAYLIAYLIYIPVVMIASYRISSTLWDSYVIKMMLFNVFLFSMLFSIHRWFPDYFYPIGTLLLALSCLVSIRYFNRIISLSEILKRLKGRK